jgi:hypothetical protein
MPVYNTDPRWLRAAIGSVQTQLYSNWELCQGELAGSGLRTSGTTETIFRKPSW